METYTIYADVLFFINFTADFICLFVTEKLTARRTALWRLLIASAFGGSYSLLYIIMPELPAFITITLHLISGLLIVFTAFGLKKAIISFAVYFLSSSFLGGIISALLSAAGNTSEQDGSIPWWLLTVFITALGVCVFIYLLLCRKKLKSRSCTLTFCHNKLTYKLNMLVDTGCFVRDPLSGNPVAVVAAAKLENISSGGPDADTLNKIGKTARIVWINTVAGRQMLAAFVAENAAIAFLGDKKGKKLSLTVAIDVNTDNYNGYDGIIPYECT